MSAFTHCSRDRAPLQTSISGDRLFSPGPRPPGACRDWPSYRPIWSTVLCPRLLSLCYNLISSHQSKLLLGGSMVFSRTHSPSAVAFPLILLLFFVFLFLGGVCLPPLALTFMGNCEDIYADTLHHFLYDTYSIIYSTS